MRGLPLVLSFVLLTVLSWGVYGPVLHHGQMAMGLPDPATGKLVPSRWLPFICVGLAYFLIAVVVPWVKLMVWGERGRWSARGATYSLIAGAVGALGALGVILAFNFGGSPLYVMPLIFGGAPVVNTVFSMVLGKTYRRVRLPFLVGLALVVLGAALVLIYKPTGGGPAGRQAQFWPVALSVLMTMVCWGAYGPVLHIGQAAMQGSRMRPFMCVGLAYFLIAVLIPLGILQLQGQPGGRWTAGGTAWSLAAGAAGALGALGVILAFDFGGKPVYVMPLVFGGAPVVNTLTGTVEAALGGKPLQFQALFLAGLAAVIAGAVMVLVFAPRPAPHKTAEEVAPEGSPQPASG